MPDNHWRLQVTQRGLAPLSALLPEAVGAADDLDGWLDREDIPDGAPYLISPGLEYDIDLDRYFLRSALAGASRNMQLAAARDVRRFLDFLWCARGGLGWRDAAVAAGAFRCGRADRGGAGPGRGLRQLTRQSDSSVLIKAMRYGHDYTARIDFSSLARATETLHATNAFNEPASSERLRLPDASH